MTTWADMGALLDAAEPHVRGVRGRELAETSRTQSRAKVWAEHSAAIAGLTGDIGTGLPEYASTETPVMDPEYRRSRDIFTDFQTPAPRRRRPPASDHLDLPRKPARTRAR